MDSERVICGEETIPLNGAAVKSGRLDYLRSTLRYRVLEWKPQRLGYRRPPRAEHTALRVTGGIGDLVLAIGPAEALNRKTGDVVIYCGWPDIGKLFTSIPCRHLDEIFDDGLDIMITLNSLAIFQFARNWKRWHNRALEQIYVANQDFLCRDVWADIAEYHPYLDNVMGGHGAREGLTRYDVTFASLGLPVEVFHRPLNQPRPINRPYVTIHDGFDINNKMWGTNRATKTWSVKQWQELTDLLRRYHGLEVVQLGGPTSRRVPGVDIDLVGVLTFKQSLAWLENSACHFDGDSGLTHSAHVLRTPTVAMYGPTPKDFFGYRANENIGAPFCGNCWWLTPDWVARCPAGYETPACMDSITPHRVYMGYRSLMDRIAGDAARKQELVSRGWRGN